MENRQLRIWNAHLSSMWRKYSHCDPKEAWSGRLVVELIATTGFSTRICWKLSIVSSSELRRSYSFRNFHTSIEKDFFSYWCSRLIKMPLFSVSTSPDSDNSSNRHDIISKFCVGCLETKLCRESLVILVVVYSALSSWFLSLEDLGLGLSRGDVHAQYTRIKCNEYLVIHHRYL